MLSYCIYLNNSWIWTNCIFNSWCNLVIKNFLCIVCDLRYLHGCHSKRALHYCIQSSCWTCHSMRETGSASVWRFHGWFSSTVVGISKASGTFLSFSLLELFCFMRGHYVFNKIASCELVGLQWHDSIGFREVSPWI